MQLPDTILKMLSAKSGININTPAGCEQLRNDIEVSTGEPLSINTVKRLAGVIPYDGAPRTVTLDIIARYLGYSSWSFLLNDLASTVSDFNMNHTIIDCTLLPPDTILRLCWEPGRRVELRSRGNGVFTVVSSEKSKLAVGDTVSLTMAVAGFPLYASEVVRNKTCLGTYTAAKECGITSAEIISYR